MVGGAPGAGPLSAAGRLLDLPTLPSAPWVWVFLSELLFYNDTNLDTAEVGTFANLWL